MTISHDVSTTPQHAIEIKLNQVQQLFDSHDPAPFRERDLDKKAEDYIVESFKALKTTAPIQLIIHLPENQILPHTELELIQAIRHHFTLQANFTRRKITDLLTQGQWFFLTGIVFLAVCTYFAYYLLHFTDAILKHTLGEGLNIIGWVAMWKPIEIFLYDWRPLRVLYKCYRSLSEIEIHLISVNN